MSYYNSISNKFNRFILLIYIVSPFVAYLTYTVASIDFNKIFTALTFIGVAIILFFSKKDNPIRIPKYLWFYLLFTLYVFYSEFFLLNRKFKLIYLTYEFVGAFNLLFIVENLSINKKYYEYIFKISKVILIIAVLVIIIQQVYSLNFFIRSDAINKVVEAGNEDRLYSIYTWTSGQAHGLTFVPIFLFIVERFQKKRDNKKIIIWILIGIVYAILTRFRWIVVNTLLVFIMLMITERNKLQMFFKYLIIFPFILMISYSALNFAGADVKGIVEDRFLEKGARGGKTSASTRLLAFSVFNKLYWKNATFGVGNLKYGMAVGKKQGHNYELSKALGGRSSQIHVGHINVLYTYGLIGGFLFFMFLFFCMKMLYINAKKTKTWAPFFGFLCLILANFTLVHFSILEVGLIFSILSSKYFIEQKKRLKIKYE